MRFAPSLLAIVVASTGFSCRDYPAGSSATSLDVSPLRLDLGGAWVGDAVSGEVRIRNDGHRAAGLRIDGAPGELFVAPRGLVVPAGEEATIAITYRPVEVGLYAAELALVDAGGRTLVTLPVAGEGIEPALELPAELDLGDAVVGGRTALQIVVKNLAPLPVRAPIVRVEGADAEAFTSMFVLGEVPAAAGALLDVAFAPRQRGEAHASLSIAACEACPPVTAALTGKGLDAVVVSEPGRLDFGVVSPGTQRTLEFRLRNDGDDTARILSASIGDPAYRIEARTWPIVLPPGASETLWATFEPTEIGDHEIEAWFLGEQGPFASVILAGHGGGAILAVDEAVDLGRVPLGWSGVRTTIVRNIGEPISTTITSANLQGAPGWTLVEPVAGLEAGLVPATIGLAFAGHAAGRADGELVITTTDLEQPELRIPLRAEVFTQGDCQIRGGPDPLRFGLVRSGGRYARDLTLENVGSGSCLVWGLSIAEGSDPDFSLGEREGTFLEIPPAGLARVQVTFAPDSLTGVVQRATVVWRTSNAATPPGRILLTGLAGSFDLVAEPNPLDFGQVPLDRVPHRTIAVQNRGMLAATLAGSSFAAGSSPRITVPVTPSYPAVLVRNDVVLYEAYYDPDRVGADRAELEIRVSGFTEPLLVTIQGEGHQGPCGQYCEPPIPVCPGTLDGIIHYPVNIPGSASDPNGDPFTCAWRVIDAPAGSIARPQSPDTCVTSFLPDEVGDYRLQLTATDDLGNAASCVTRLAVGPGAVLAVDEAVDLGRVPLGWSGNATTVVRNIGQPMSTTITAAYIQGASSWTLAAPVTGLEVGFAPATIRLAFVGHTVGRADGELILATTDLEQPELRIPLRAEVFSAEDCQVRGGPDPLRFGLVASGGRYVREVTLENIGTGSCVVWGMGMEAGSDPDFSLNGGASPFVEIAAGQRARVPITFAPDAITGALQQAAVIWRTSNASAPQGRVALTGLAGDVDLVADPNPLDFRLVPLDRVPHRTILVRNRGVVVATLTGHSLTAGSSPQITVPTVPSYPAVLARNDVAIYEAYYEPDRVGPDRSGLEIHVSGFSEPLIVTIQGEGHEGPCGAYCEPPIPVCPASQVVVVNRPVNLAGSASDPNGDPFTCAWRVIERPEGSTEQPQPPDTCATSFTSDAVGTYRLELTATDDLGNADSCVTVLDVRPPGGGLWVEMYWETYSNDFDLHLLHGGNGGNPQLQSSWRMAPWACFYSNKTPSWDAPGIADDPSLDRDVTSGTGVENIRIDQPSIAHPYHVGLVWYSQKSDPITWPVVINVYCYGVQVANVITNMTKTPTGPGPYVFVGTVQFHASGSCDWTPVGTIAP